MASVYLTAESARQPWGLMSLFCTNVADVFFFSHDNIRMIPMLYSYIPICVAEKRCRQKWAVWESNLPMRDDECIENIIFGTTLCFFFTLLKKKKKKIIVCIRAWLTFGIRALGSGWGGCRQRAAIPYGSSTTGSFAPVARRYSSGPAAWSWRYTEKEDDKEFRGLVSGFFFL